MGKTKFQWLALICWIAGVAFNLVGWVTKSWFFILAPFVLWGVCLWCVVYRPVNKSTPTKVKPGSS